MFRNPVFSFAMLTASVLCATTAFAQSTSSIEHWRGGYSSPTTSSPAFSSGSYRSNQPLSGYNQGSSVNSTRVQSGFSYGQGQTCANGSCSTRNAAYPVVSSTAAPIMNHSTYSVAQYPVVTSPVQSVHNVYYPQQSLMSYSPYTVHYGADQAFSTSPMSSCSGSVSSYGYSYR